LEKSADNILINKFNQTLWTFVLLAFGVLAGLMIAKMEILGVLALFAILPGLIYFGFIIKYPIFGLFTGLNISFIVFFLIRYVGGPFGTAIDGILFLVLIISVVKSSKENLKNINSLPFYIFGTWLLYTIFQLFNPLAPNFMGWIYSIRGTSFNFFVLTVTALLLFNDKKYINWYLYIWMAWSFIAALWGFRQKFIGLDGVERAWLAAGNATTHILHGKLRVFSFYSDAGQFGVAMAMAAMVGLIVAVGPGSWLRKSIFGLVGLVCLYAMAVSGTRGALFVPAAGGLVYLLVNRNFSLLAVGTVAGLMFFGMLKYTHIGQGNYEIQRLRSALDPEDASLNVRLENQRKLAFYLKDKPFGAGIGTSGYFGHRYNPGSVLAEIPTDSWYVRIWAETGVVGLFIHLGGLLLLLVVGFFKVFTLHDPALRNIMAAFLAGYAGIVVANYGNQVMGQYPTNVVTIIGICLIWHSSKWDRPESVKDQ